MAEEHPPGIQNAEELLKLFDKYKSSLIVGIDNVDSEQMRMIRNIMGDRCEIMTINDEVRGHLQDNNQFKYLLSYVVGNAGLVFTNQDLDEIWGELSKIRVRVSAKSGFTALHDINLLPQKTDLGPSPSTLALFRTLGIPFNFSDGKLHIINEVTLISAGEKISDRVAKLLNMLKIEWFSYGLVFRQAFSNGEIYSIKDVAAAPLISASKEQASASDKNLPGLRDPDIEEATKIIRLFLSLKDHNERIVGTITLDFTDGATVRDLRNEILSKFHIPTTYQTLSFLDNGSEKSLFKTSSDSPLASIGLTNGTVVIVKHAQVNRWPLYTDYVDKFREASDNKARRAEAIRARDEASLLEESGLFRAYVSLALEWNKLRGTYATYLDNFRPFIEEAANFFFIAQFHDKKDLKITFKDKKKGTRDGVICIVNANGMQQRVYFIKTNHSASTSLHHAPLNMIELFVYVLLEVMSVGATIQFITNTVHSDKILYICGDEIEGFQEFEELIENWPSFETRIVKHREKFADHVLQLSVLSQMLCLADMNGQNFGFSYLADANRSSELHVVDFRIDEISMPELQTLDMAGRQESGVVNGLALNLGSAVLNLDKTPATQLRIAKDCVKQWGLPDNLDKALKQFNERRKQFKRPELLFGRGTNDLNNYIELVRDWVARINAS